MTQFVCVTCGTQYPHTDAPPAQCPICQDERQYVPPAGQRWTTLDDLRKDHHNVITALEPGLSSVRTEPGFAIGQQAYLIQTPEGNVLWDCISLIDEATVTAIQAMGGVSAIAISHPHFYSGLGAWSAALGDVPVYLHGADRAHVMNPIPAIRFWEGDSIRLNPQITLIRCGGHFDGSTVLYWSQGAIFTADTITIVQDARYVSFMYSYPNLIPLPPAKVRGIVAAVQPYPFDRIYGGWNGKIIPHGGREAIEQSAARYIRALTEA